MDKVNARIFIIKLVHSIIFFIMVFCLIYILYCAVTGRYDWTLLLALGTLSAEGIALLLNRGTCPLTALAVKLGAASGSVTDIFVPMWCARHTFKISVVVVIIELIWLGIGYFT